MLFKGILLICMNHIKAERTINAVFHLLTGKKSVQTIQDAHLYRLENYYGIYPTLRKSSFHEKVEELSNKNMIKRVNKTEPFYVITEQANNWINQYQTKLPLHYFKGIHYVDVSEVYMKRLLIFIQVMTNSKKKCTAYIPIIEEDFITSWVKQLYPTVKDYPDFYLKNLYKELELILSTIRDSDAQIFIDRFTGFGRYGLSIHQLSEKYKKNIQDIQILLVGITQYMLQKLYEQENNYPTLFMIAKGLRTNKFLTASARHTYELLQNKYPIIEIARIRDLKINTIQDHIVEISLSEHNFSIDQYVTKEDQLLIMKQMQALKTTKLKAIKENVHEHISYFQIRLVLAKQALSQVN